jgi:4-hydroxyacetophenone monooxygenase
MDAKGRRGITIGDYFRVNGPTAYLGTLAPGFPNLFRIYGSFTFGSLFKHFT